MIQRSGSTEAAIALLRSWFTSSSSICLIRSSEMLPHIQVDLALNCLVTYASCPSMHLSFGYVSKTSYSLVTDFPPGGQQCLLFSHLVLRPLTNYSSIAVSITASLVHSSVLDSYYSCYNYYQGFFQVIQEILSETQ